MDEHVSQSKTASFGYHQVPEDEKSTRVRRHFNTVAAKYDLMNTVLSFGIHYAWKRTAVNMLGLSPTDRVLDVCGGTGDLAVRAAKYLQHPRQIVLYDVNRDMIVTGRVKHTVAAIRKLISYVQGDAEKIAFADQSFDAVMVGFGIRNLTHMRQGFKEIYRVLKPGGKMICLEFSKPTAPLFRRLYDLHSFYVMPFLGELVVGSRRAYTYLPESSRLFPLPQELATTLEEIGFSNVRYRKLTNGIAVVHLGTK